MTTILLELALLFALLVLNGVFAMTEIAVVSSKKTRLRALAKTGDSKAKAALLLAEDPNRFLSTVQIGITLIGIFAGAFGGATVASQLALALEPVPIIGAFANEVAFLIVVAILTFFSLVIGELVPKRIGLLYPETLARFAARPMRILSRAMGPIVHILGFATDTALRLIGVRPSGEPSISEEEITGMIHEGTRAGVFLPTEGPMVARVLALDRLRVREIMTPRPQIVWLDADASADENWRKIVGSSRSRFPVYEKTHDHILGIVTVKSLYANLAADASIDLRSLIRPPLYVSELQSAAHFLEDLKRSKNQFSLVTDEFGTVSGLATLNDVTEAIVGHLPEPGRPTQPTLIRRADGSWLVDGLTDWDDLIEKIPTLASLATADSRTDTLAGFVTEQTGHLPPEGHVISVADHRFEVIDLDQHRIDKILITPPESLDSNSGSPPEDL